jgi:hybrid polyketide synthase/nonribosomal peptide synthetase ACE1
MKMLSPSGRCRMWDADGDGYARGEGIAAVILKRLCDAVADGDEIHCVIRESNANQGGWSSGLTVPNSSAQVDLIRRTYTKAGLDLGNPSDRCQYFESHGIGTKVGDLKEASAIHGAFSEHPGLVVARSSMLEVSRL